MPQNTDFSIQVLVGGSPIPEYEKDGRYYVESNLATPFSYRQESTDVVQGEVESQMWPVTPYTLCLCARTKGSEPCYYRIIVDGVKVKGLSIAGGQARIIKGFRDGACIREFLFSMPRFARDQADRIDEGRKEAVGCIEIQCWNATLRKTKFGLKRNYLEFEQANKKDSTTVTNGEYTMATSKAGKVVCSRSLYRSVDNWKLTTLRSSIKINYHMGHTLQSMGFTLRPFEFREEALKKNSVVRLKRPQRLCISEPGRGSSGERSSGKSSDQDSSQDATDVAISKEGQDSSKRKRKTTPTLIDLTSDGEEEGSSSANKKTKVAKTEIKTEKDILEKKSQKEIPKDKSGDKGKDDGNTGHDKRKDDGNTGHEPGENSPTGKDKTKSVEESSNDPGNKDDKNDSDKDDEAEPCLAAEPLPMSEEIASLLQTLGVKVPGADKPEEETPKAMEEGTASNDSSSDVPGTKNQEDDSAKESPEGQSEETEQGENKEERTNSAEPVSKETRESSAEKEVINGMLDKIEMCENENRSVNSESGDVEEDNTPMDESKGTEEEGSGKGELGENEGSTELENMNKEAGNEGNKEMDVEDSRNIELSEPEETTEQEKDGQVTSRLDNTESAIIKGCKEGKAEISGEPMDTEQVEGHCGKDDPESGSSKDLRESEIPTKEAEETRERHEQTDGENPTESPELAENENLACSEDLAQGENSTQSEKLKESVQKDENSEDKSFDKDTVKETSLDEDTEKDGDEGEECLKGVEDKKCEKGDEVKVCEKGNEGEECEKEKDSLINNDELSDVYDQNIPEESNVAEKSMPSDGKENETERSYEVTAEENALLDENREINVSKEWETSLDEV